MKCVSTMLESGRLEDLLETAIPALARELDGARVDLAAVFATPHFEDDVMEIVESVRRDLAAEHLFGNTAEGVIGVGREIERRPAVSVFAAHLPDAWCRPFRIATSDVDALDADDAAPALIPDLPDRPEALLLLGDPFSLQIMRVLRHFDAALPACPVIGGMASGAEAPGQTVLMLGDRLFRDGAVGIALGGAIDVATVVSQGCRPIGERFVITRAERNVVHELGGKPALAQLVGVLDAAAGDDQELAQSGGLFIGVAMDEHRPSFGRGDFLVRNLMEVDRESGAIAVNDYMRVGVTVQFHVRDASSAHEDLDLHLDGQADREAAGALVFTCNGRGVRMWSEPNHDAERLAAALGPVPTAGMFAAGELGSVGGRNYIHGHTASIAILRPPRG